jgi:hypothetical protein
MRKTYVALIATAITTSILNPTVVHAAAKIGATCSKPNATSTVTGVSVKCVKTGSKYTWKKVAAPKPSTKASATAVPEQAVTFPTSFADLKANRKGISQAAWAKVNAAISTNAAKIGTFEIFTGPNTKPYYEDYLKVATLVSKLFPNTKEPSSNIVIRYKYEDLTWAEAKVAQLLPKSEIERLNRDESGRLLSSNCESSRNSCDGSKQLTTTTGVNVILQGVPVSVRASEPEEKERFFTGMLEAHEYFHSFQRIPLLNKPLEQKDYPPVWFVEGAAEWVQNAVVNGANFQKYKNYFTLDCRNSCNSLSQADIAKILTESTNSYWPNQYDYFLNYSLGSVIIESLVALTNPESIVALYEQIATRIGFEAAFKSVYGTEWKLAIPILAEVTFLNLQGK